MKQLFYQARLHWPGAEDWLRKIQVLYQQRPLMKPATWTDDVHTSMQFARCMTTGDNGVPAALIEILHTHVDRVVDQHGLAVLGEFYISEAWYNAYGLGQYQNKHKHSGRNTMFAGVYYAKYDSLLHTATRFYNPAHEVDFDTVGDHPYLVYEPEVTAGDVLIFPSEVGHEVPGQRSDRLRVTVSFNVNCTFKPKNLDYA